ncbi:MAG: Flagellin N-methylase [Methanocella sp. PtaU1.Bin125]|nr:MAG: Flagellin N-methylase [Methanocella sp. PtaU1.Bin125]
MQIDIREYQCNRCGACCKHQDGIIISLNDAHLLARRLRMPLKNFVRKYCREAGVFDVFGHGPFRGLAIRTKKGVCPFYSGREGCTVNEAKPAVCRLYPFNTIHVTRASLLKMQRKKDGDCYDSCYIFSIPDEGVIGPDYEALAAHWIRMETTREYYRLYGDRWQEDQAQKAIASGARLSGDPKSVGLYARQLRAAFDELDRMNEGVLLELFADKE